MFRALLTFAILVAMSVGFVDKGFATEPVYGVTVTEERVIQLPQDQNKCFLSVIGDPADPKFAQVQKWFKENPNLTNLKNQTHFNVYAKGTVMYAERYGKTTNGRTTIRLQNADGSVAYEKVGNQIPMTAEGLHNSIRTECIFKRWRQNRQQRMNPNQEQVAVPDEGILGDQEVQPLDAEPMEPDSGPNILVIVLAGMGGLVVGSAVGAGYAYKKQHYDSAA